MTKSSLMISPGALQIPRFCSLLISLLLLTSSAWPSPAPDKGFYEQENLPLKPAYLERAIDATKSILDLSSAASCGGAFISDDGYFLTALHCVDQCVIANHAAAQLKGNGYELLKVTNQTSNLPCSRSYPPDPELAEFGIAEAFTTPSIVMEDPEIEKSLESPTLVLIGKGLTDIPNPRKALRFSEETKQQIEGIGDEDYAILKFHLPTKKACIPTAPRPPEMNDQVWTIGYPGAAKRNRHTSSDGFSQYISYGTILPATYMDPSIRKHYRLTSEKMNRYNAMLPSHGTNTTFDSDLDHSMGSSGGPVIDRNGDLVGVFFSGESNQRHYYRSNATSVAIAFIQSEVSRILGENKAKEIFHCTR